MVDTLNEEPEDAAEDIDVSKMLENVDTNEEAVTEEPKAEESETEESETAGLFFDNPLGSFFVLYKCTFKKIYVILKHIFSL